ncbi:MAG TPA: autotransporter outer membrane beta-barrel domain-containing protein [Caulobacteraceae bacterium]
MKRKFLAVAAAAPLLAASIPALAQVTISTATSTPVATATANNGAPSDVTIAAGGSITLTAPGTELKLNSNNSIDNAGALSGSGVDDLIGIDILGGFTGTATNTGSITLNESSATTADPNNGLATGPFATGSGRIGLEVTGAGVFTGSIIDTGSISIIGNNSAGVTIQAPVSGDFLMQVVTPPASGSTTPTVTDGTISITGANSVGLQVTSSGSVGGNMPIQGVSALGAASQAVQINGNVGGWMNFSGAVVSTGYRTTTRSTNPFLAATFTREEMQQGGAAVTLGGNVVGGVILSAPPPVSSTNPDVDNDGVPDNVQGTASVISYGSSPAMQIGAVGAGGGAAPAIAFGAFTKSDYFSANNPAPPAKTFGLVVQGSIGALGLFDPLTSPNLPGVVSATALQIGGQILVTPAVDTFNSSNVFVSTTPAVWAAAGAVTIAGGLYNSGNISAQAYQADATAIHIGADPLSGHCNPCALVTLPTIYNDGQITANSVQVNSATTQTINGGNLPPTPAPLPVNVTAVLIEKDSNVSSIVNNSGILAELTGTGGVGGKVTAIIDKSGSLVNITNTGSIDAVLNNTLATTPLPLVGADGTSNTVAIDISAGTAAQTITQGFSAVVAAATPYVATQSYAIGAVVSFNGNIYKSLVAVGPGADPVSAPTDWSQIGAVTPTIGGDIYFGSGPSTLNVTAGIVASTTIAMGAGLNTVNVQGSAAGPNGAPNSPIVSGYLSERAGGSFALSVGMATLRDTNPNAVAASSINIGSGGVLVVAADPGAPGGSRNTDFINTGLTKIAADGQIGLTLLSLQAAPSQTYTVIEGALGSITAPNLGPTAIGNTPFLYTATSALVADDPATGKEEVQLTVERKTAAQLGFNAGEAGALNAVLAALPVTSDAGIQAQLLAQTTEAGLKSVYDQLLPNQGQGIFHALDAAAQKISTFTGGPPDVGTHIGGSSLWLQEVNERIDRSGLDSVGSSSKLLGLVGGYERMGVAGGALGLSLAYFNVQESDEFSALGAHDVGSLVEAGLYYRRSIGHLTVSARGAGGYGWFSEDRRFASGTEFDRAQASWTGSFIDAHFGAGYEVKIFGPYYARPEVSLDYLTLHQSGYAENGLNPGFNLTVASQTDTQFSGQAVMVLGRQWGKANWLRAELRGGYREVFSGTVGDITANFANGTPFVVTGDPDKGGWMTVGFSLKTGSQFSYLALEGDADFRSGEQRFDLRVAGRSIF